MDKPTHEKNCNKLFEMCLDIITPKINSYADYLDQLPEYAKYRVLTRITKLKYGIQNDNVMKSLVQPGLKMVNLSSSRITDESLKILAQCKLMNKLTFSKGLYHMTAEGLIYLFTNLKHLRYLYIADCNAMNDKVLDCLKKHCLQLTELDIGGCNVTNEGMKSLSLMSQLSSLNISRTPITDGGLKYLTSGICKNSLSEIRICACPITDFGVNIIANNCPLLSTLICNDCDIKDMASSVQTWKLPMKQISWTINFERPPLF